MRRWGVGKKFCLRGQGRSYVGERGRQLCIFSAGIRRISPKQHLLGAGVIRCYQLGG